MIELSIVVPVYNSEHCLEELARRIEAALGESWQLVLVDDCSRDGSWAVIRRLAEADARIVGVRLRRNAGQDNAIMAGLRHAAGRYVVIMDDDLQHSPSDIPALHAQAEQGYDVCYANFWKKRQKLWKNLGSWFKRQGGGSGAGQAQGHLPVALQGHAPGDRGGHLPL